MTRGTFVCAAGMTLASVTGLCRLALAAPDKSTGPGLAAEHIICGEQFRPDPRVKLPALKQCTDTAAAFYKEEWLPQVQGLLAGDPKAMESLRPATTFELPDGSTISGSNIGAYFPTLFGANAAQVTGGTDDFTFKPVDRDTVLVFGMPKFNVKGRDGAAYVIASAQLSVYRRTHNGVPTRGWEELGELWTYQSPNKGPKPVLPPAAPAPAPAAPPAKSTK